MTINAYRVLMLAVAALGAFALFWALLRLLLPSPDQEAISDLEARQIRSTSSFAKLKPNESLIDRIAVFFLETFKLQKPLEEMHMLLGSPIKPLPVDILYQKVYYVMLVPLVPLAMYIMMRSNMMLLLTFAAIPMAFILPDSRVKSEINKRQQDMMGNFSTTVDLTALVIESGLDYMTAFERIVKIAKQKTILEVEIEKMLNETKLGYSRREALERFASRTGVQDIRSFVGLIVQSDELGTSLVDLLRNFSVDLRFRRLSKAEKLAAQAATKMLIPLFIFIFPVVFIMMLAPMIADFATGGMPF